MGDHWMKRWIRRVTGIHLGWFDIHRPHRPRIPARYARTPRASGRLRVSIVTPVYNQASFIEQTILSVFRQDYPSLEYIVKDGGSTDGTVEILARYADRVSRIESGADGGQADAINTGMRFATGDVLAYLNADDLLLPGAVHYVTRFFENHPQIDVAYGHRILINEHGDEIGRWVLPPHDDRVLSWIDCVPQETMFWRRRIWEKCAGAVDETFQFALDWDLLVRFRDAGAHIVRLPRFLGAFRIHPDQKTISEMEHIGQKEMERIRLRCLGRIPSTTETIRAVAPYLIKHSLYNRIEQLFRCY